MTPLSIFLITKNEADRLPRTLDAIKGLGDEIIIIDSGSTDSTQNIAREAGAKIIHQDWLGYGGQKRFAEEQCKNDWVLNIDADEVIPPDLYQEIKTLMSGTPDKDAYRIRIAEIFPTETKPHPFAYTLKPVRLYNKNKGRYSPSPVHDRVEMQEDARIGRLKGTIHHFSVRSLGDQIDKLNRYTDMQADDLEQRKIHISSMRVLLEFPAAFIKAYIFRRHALRGVYGFLTAMNYAFSRHLRLAKHYERKIKQ